MKSDVTDQSARSPPLPVSIEFRKLLEEVFAL